MKYFFVIILFIIFFSLTQIASAEEVLMWMDCVKEAKQNHPDLISALEEINQAKAGKEITRSDVLPRISSNLNAKTSKQSDTYSYGVTGQQLLFDGFKTSNELLSAQENINSREVIYTPPPPLEVPHLMKEFVDWLNKTEDLSPIILAGIAQFQLVHIHPFLDGNGRTARLLSTLILYKTGYDFKRLFTISEYYDKDRPIYYQAIQSVRQNNMDMTAWLSYFVEGFHSQMAEIHEKGKKAISSEKLIKILQDYNLNHRQERIVRYLVINERIDNDKCQKLCGSIRRTATRDLSLLVKKGILEMRGELKGAYYILSSTISKI